MSLAYRIKRIRVRRFTPTEAIVLSMLVGGGIVALGLVLGSLTQTRAAGPTPTWSVECTVLGCGRAVV